MKARKAYILPELKNQLITISQLSDSGYMPLFDKEKVFAIKDMKVVLQGIRNQNELSIIDLKNKSSKNMPQLQEHHIKNIQAANNIYAIESKEKIIKYYHRCLLFPTISTWVSAINQGFFTSWHGSTS